MKRLVILFLLCGFSIALVKAQSITSQPFTVNGDFDKFYPVVFTDASWYHGATEFEITRAEVHTNSTWRGSIVSKFRLHTTQWGHGSNFIDADIHKSVVSFIADWRDATSANGSLSVIIWLRGGGTTYWVRSTNSTMGLPSVYDGVQNSLPYQEMNGPAHSYKTDVIPTINQNGITYSGDAFTNGNGIFFGNVGIGTTNPQNKLDVNGTIRAREIIATLDNWSDFVFNEDYKLMSLSDVEKYINANKKLPDIPSTDEVTKDGINLGDMDAKLLRKIEELTIYVIELNKKIEKLESEKH